MKQFCCTLLFFLATLTSYAQNFADFFQDKTLRVDYIFTGDANRQAIYLDEPVSYTHLRAHETL